MDMKEFVSKHIIKILLLPILAACGAMFYRKFYWVPQDNPLEEKIEQVIKHHTGSDIDLSPDTKE